MPHGSMFRPLQSLHWLLSLISFRLMSVQISQVEEMIASIFEKDNHGQ